MDFIKYPELVEKLKQRIQRKNYICVTINFPTHTWSARRNQEGLREDRRVALRTTEGKEIYGRHNLPSRWDKEVQNDNKMLNITIDIIEHCIKWGVIAVLVNPESSLIWKEPRLTTLRGTGNGVKVVQQNFDMCQYGDACKKPGKTCIWLPKGSQQFKLRLRRCKGKRGYCSENGGSQHEVYSIMAQDEYKGYREDYCNTIAQAITRYHTFHNPQYTN